MTDLPIVIVSRGRAGRISTFPLFPDATLCVPGDEVDAYRAAYPDVALLPQPDDVVGLAATRQWLWDRYGDVFLADDDLTALVDLVAGPGEPSRVPPEKAAAIVQAAAHTARQLGAAIFGFANTNRPQGYDEHRPVALTGVINFSSTGLFRSERLFLRPDLSLYDDFWLSLLNAYYHRSLFVEGRYGFVKTDTFHNPGGCATERTEAELKVQFARLKAAFGPAVQERQPGPNRPVWSAAMASVRLPF